MVHDLNQEANDLNQEAHDPSQEATDPNQEANDQSRTANDANIQYGEADVMIGIHAEEGNAERQPKCRRRSSSAGEVTNLGRGRRHGGTGITHTPPPTFKIKFECSQHFTLLILKLQCSPI